MKLVVILPALLLAASQIACADEHPSGLNPPECYLEENTAWPGNDVEGGKIKNVTSIEDCREKCQKIDGATYFTWRGEGSKPTGKRKNCYCKKARGRSEEQEDVFSGLAKECCEVEEKLDEIASAFHMDMQCEDGSCKSTHSRGNDGYGCNPDTKYIVDKHCGHMIVYGDTWYDYLCDNGQCLSNAPRSGLANNYRWARCNKKTECDDGSDEKDCEE